MDTALQDRTAAQLYPTRATAENDPSTRGTLKVSKRVVEKIASQAALEISAAGGTSGGFLGFGAAADLSTRPAVSVDLSGHTASIQVDVALAYPTPIARAAEQVRSHMMSRVHELAGVKVTRVDVRIIALARHHKDKEVLR